MLDDGQRVLPPYVNRADFDYEAREKGALHAWDSGVLQARTSIVIGLGIG